MRKYNLQEQPTLGSSTVGYGTRLLVGVVESVDLDTYQCKITLSDLGGVRTATLNPGVVQGTNWVRHIPTPGTPVLVSYRPQGLIEIIAFYDNASQPNIQNYKEGISLYRSLVGGENDTMSIGRAGHWETNMGRYLSHAGTVFLELNRDSHELHAEAGHISLESPQASDLTYAKLGTVKRKIGKSEVVCTTDGKPISKGGTELRAFELSVACDPASSLSEDLPSSGPRLMDVRAGHVVDDSGSEEQDPDTSGNLRFRMRVHNEQNSFFVDTRMDDEGNLVLMIPPTATVGVLMKLLGGNLQIMLETGDVVVGAQNVSVSSAGSISTQAKEDTVVGSGKRVFLTAGSEAYVIAEKEMDISARTISIGADKDVRVSSALESVVSGDKTSRLESIGTSIVSAPDVRLGDDTATLRLLLETFIPVFMSHTHTGVKEGDGVSGPVSGPAPEGVLTTKTKAT